MLILIISLTFYIILSISKLNILYYQHFAFPWLECFLLMFFFQKVCKLWICS